MNTSHRDNSSSFLQTANALDPSTSAEGQALANVLGATAFDGLIPPDIPLELEEWAQEMAAAAPLGGAPMPAAIAAAAGGGEIISEGGSGDQRGSAGYLRRPVDEEFRKKRAEQQIQYRKRRDSKAQVAQESLKTTANQVFAAREEQNSLQLHMSVLQKVANYTESILQAIRGLAGNAQEAVSNLPACQVASNLLNLMLVKAVAPSDSQLR